MPLTFKLCEQLKHTLTFVLDKTVTTIAKTVLAVVNDKSAWGLEDDLGQHLAHLDE